jgi:Protein of unknown function (DUF2971)
VIYNFRTADQLVYHYTESSIAIQYILKDSSLRFGTYTKTNDPKESKTWQFGLGTNNRADLGEFDTDALSAWLSAAIKGSARLACFSMDTGPLSGNHIEEIFKRGFCKARMWAQYADRHTGVCLVFDRQKLNESVEKRFGVSHQIFRGPVNYVDRGVIQRLEDHAYTIDVDHLQLVGSQNYARDHLLTYYQRFFFEKLRDWRDESEYRWIVVGANPVTCMLT